MTPDADVTFGHRVFVIDGERFTRISQRSFQDFYQRDMPSLPQFAGKTVDVAVAFFTLDGRKPKQIVQLDTMRIKVTESGAIDPLHKDEALRLVVNAISWGEGESNAKGEAGNVIDAKRRFDKRRSDVHHPKLSGPIHKRILEALFK
jgi:hypothetical protein